MTTITSCRLARLAILALASCMLASTAWAVSEEDETKYINLYGNIPRCDPAIVQTPTNTQEVAEIVKKLYAQQQAGKKVTVRASHHRFHTTAGFACPTTPGAGPDSIQPDSVQVGLLHSKLNKVLAVNKTKRTMRVGAGMTVAELTGAAAKAGLSVQIGSLPAYAGLTLAGLVATHGHGTGDMKASAFADTVIGVTWVDGKGEIHKSTKTDPEFKGFAGGLGAFGIMTELTVKMTPVTATTLETYSFLDDSNIMADINSLLKLSPHVHIVYHPDHGKMRAFVLKKAAKGTKINRSAKMFLMPDLTKVTTSKSFIQLLGKAFDIWSSTVNDDSEFSKFTCPQVPFNGQLGMHWAGVGTDTGLFNVTGLTNKMQSTDCSPGCVWTPGFTYNASWHDVEFTIEFDQLEEWLADIKKVVELELKENGAAPWRCFGSGYIMIRFGKPYNGITATAAGMKRPVYVETVWYRSDKHSELPIHYQFVADLIEELTLCKYRGRPHWGKNWDRTFTHPKCPVPPLYPKFQDLLTLATKYDPGGMFKSAMFDKLQKGEVYKLTPKCSVTQQCYCGEDSNCADGFSCKASLAFPEYKLCKSPMTDIKNSVLGPLIASLGRK